MAKLKRYRHTFYYRGCELDVICHTTSMNKFAELYGKTSSQIRPYTYIIDVGDSDKYKDLTPDVLYVERGMGGEVIYFIEKDVLMLLDEAKAIIDKHREICKNYNETIEWFNNKNK